MYRVFPKFTNIQRGVLAIVSGSSKANRFRNIFSKVFFVIFGEHRGFYYSETMNELYIKIQLSGNVIKVSTNIIWSCKSISS